MRQVQTLSKASLPGTRDRGLARAVPREWRLGDQDGPPDATRPLGALQVCDLSSPPAPQVAVFTARCPPCNGSGGPSRQATEETHVDTRGLCSGVKEVTLNITSRSFFQRRPPPPCSEAGALNGRDFQNLGNTKCSPLARGGRSQHSCPSGTQASPSRCHHIPLEGG